MFCPLFVTRVHHSAQLRWVAVCRVKDGSDFEAGSIELSFLA